MQRKNIFRDFSDQCGHCSFMGHQNSTTSCFSQVKLVWTMNQNQRTLPTPLHWASLDFFCPLNGSFTHSWLANTVVQVTWKYWCPDLFTVTICWHISFYNITKSHLLIVLPVSLGSCQDFQNSNFCLKAQILSLAKNTVVFPEVTGLLCSSTKNVCQIPKSE
jgi:hypothetical protein